MKTVFIKSNGCAVLMHETERIAKYFTENDWKLVDSPEKARVLVMTCCGVTNNEEDQAIEIIREIEQQRMPDSRFFISGCMPAFAADRVMEVSPSAFILKISELDALDSVISANKPFHTVHYNVNPRLGKCEDYTFQEDDDLQLMRKIDEKYHSYECERAWEFSTLRKYMWQDERTYQIKVSYGCPGHCSYCATKLGIGDFRSIDMNLVIEQFREGWEKGYTKFLLIGDEIGNYGRDIGTSLIDLLQKLYSLSEGRAVVSIRYIHPDIFVKMYEKLSFFFAKGFVNYFCCAIQSGSPDVLKRMNRNPKLESFINCMEDMNTKNYPVNKHTQIIVGFPGETAENFLQTMDALRRCQFDHININLYSPRRHTAAWSMTDNVSQEDKAFRAALIKHNMMLRKKAILYDAIKKTVRI
ncbi:MAG: radical SAM protein [Bacteroidales bacterium]|nr:radical SAM protein [Bacteroidales bacterium]